MTDAPRTTGLRVLVCGGRNYDDLGAVWGQLDAFHAMQGPIVAIIHGGAGGADLLGEKWAIQNGVPRVSFRPDWNAYGRAAGPIRNKRMLDDGKPDLVIAFPGGRGTADMIRQATDANVEVVRPYG